MLLRNDIGRSAKNHGYNLSKICSMLEISRPTLNSYIERYCDGDRDSIPSKVLTLLDLLSDEKTTTQDVDDYFLTIPLVDVRSSKPNRMIPKDLFKFNRLYDVNKRAWTNKVHLPKNTELLSIDFDTVVRDARVKMLEYGMQASFSRFGALGIPAPTDYDLRFPDDKIRELYYLYFHLMFIHSYLSTIYHSELVLEDLEDLREDVDYAISCIEYIFKNLNDGDDEEDLEDLVAEVNRDTFDVTRKKKWYVVPYLMSNKLDPASSSTVLVMHVFGAVSFEDALNAASELYAVLTSYTPIDSAVFGPFSDEEGANRVYNYMEISWDETFEENIVSETQAREWLEQQKNKKSLSWGGV